MARALKRGFGIFHAGIVALIAGKSGFQVFAGFFLGLQHRVCQQCIRQRFQPGLPCDLRLGTALFLEGQIQVFEPRLVFRIREGSPQRRCHLALLFDSSNDYGAPVFQFAQIAQPLFQQAQLRIVQPARGLLPITRDEWHCRAFVEQGNGGGYLCGPGAEFKGKALFDGWQHMR